MPVLKPISGTKLAYSIPLWWLLVGALILLGCVSSTYTSLAVNILAILIFPVVFMPPVFNQLRRDPFVLMFVVPFVLLGFAFSLTAKTPADMLQWLNYLPLLLCIPVYVIARDISSQRTITIILSLLLAGTVIACGVGVYDLVIRGVSRAEGYLTGAIIYGRLALMLGFLAGAGVFVLKSRWRYLFLAGPALGVLATLMSGSRGVMLIVPFVGLLYLIFWLYGQRRRVWVLAIAGTILTCIAAAVVAAELINTTRLFSTVQQVIGVLSGGEGVDQSTQQRLAFYALGWDLFWQSPWIGYGWSGVHDAVMSIVTADSYTGTEIRNFFTFHNDLIQSALVGGVLGIVALVCILAAPLLGARNAWNGGSSKGLWFCALCLVIIQALSGLTDVTFGYDMPTTAFATLAALMLGLFPQRSRNGL